MTKKLFVLDTNVLLHDPQSLFRFDEHDIYIPLITLEEMDAHKVGMTDVARNARQASRYIDELFSKEPDSLTTGIPLNLAGHKEARGKLILQTSVETASLPDGTRLIPVVSSVAVVKVIGSSAPAVTGVTG